jgi:hypothetical protein
VSGLCGRFGGVWETTHPALQVALPLPPPMTRDADHGQQILKVGKSSMV